MPMPAPWRNNRGGTEEWSTLTSEAYKRHAAWMDPTLTAADSLPHQGLIPAVRCTSSIRQLCSCRSCATTTRTPGASPVCNSFWIQGWSIGYGGGRPQRQERRAAQRYRQGTRWYVWSPALASSVGPAAMRRGRCY